MKVFFTQIQQTVIIRNKLNAKCDRKGGEVSEGGCRGQDYFATVSNIKECLLISLKFTNI